MRRILPLTFVLLLTGCPDPRGMFDDFLDRTDYDLAMTDDMGTGVLADVNGSFLLSLSVTVQPDSPLQFIVDSTLTGNENGGTLSVKIHSLTNGDRMPVGDLITASSPVDAQGRFSLAFGKQTVP